MPLSHIDTSQRKPSNWYSRRLASRQSAEGHEGERGSISLHSAAQRLISPKVRDTVYPWAASTQCRVPAEAPSAAACASAEQQCGLPPTWLPLHRLWQRRQAGSAGCSRLGMDAGGHLGCDEGPQHLGERMQHRGQGMELCAAWSCILQPQRHHPNAIAPSCDSSAQRSSPAMSTRRSPDPMQVLPRVPNTPTSAPAVPTASPADAHRGRLRAGPAWPWHPP